MKLKTLGFAFVASFIMGFSAQASSNDGVDCRGKIENGDYVLPNNADCVDAAIAAVKLFQPGPGNKRIARVQIALSIHPEAAEEVEGKLRRAGEEYGFTVAVSRGSDPEGTYWEIFNLTK